jgi:hypothetical protein
VPHLHEPIGAKAFCRDHTQTVNRDDNVIAL